MQRGGILILLFALSALPWSVLARARTIWDGVYTAEQAKRGEAGYRRNCALCHGLTLTGTENAPELVGDAAFKLWYGKSVNDLFKQVQKNMPKDDPGILTAQQTADILAHVFSVNKFPAGETELPTSADALTDIAIEKSATK